METTTEPSRTRSHARILLAFVWLAGAAWGWTWLDRGWVPHDEGAIAQSAERVLAGEVPHVDFDEIYTGALTYTHALAFEVFGTRLIALRYLLFGAFLLWIPAVWSVARAFAPPWLAALATLGAVALSVPNYSASLPSWYLLFLATFAVAAMARHLETGRRGWLVAAGAAAGVSILMKIVGVYLLAAIVFWLLYEDQEASRGSGGRGGSAIVSAGLLGAAAGPAVLVRGFGASPFVQFVLPVAALAGWLGVREWRTPRGPLGPRARGWGARAGLVALGAAAPLLVFGLAYAGGGGLPALYEGVLVRPRSRLSHATMSLPRLGTAGWVAVPVVILVGAARASGRERRRIAVLLAVLAALVLGVSSDGGVYRAVWYTLRWSIPAAALAGVAVFAWRGRAEGGRTGVEDPGPPREGSPPQEGPAPSDASGRPEASRRRSLAFGALATAAWTGLVQFPFSAPIYFLYVAPLVLLAFLSLTEVGGAPRPVVAVLVAFLTLFAAIRVTPGFIYVMGFQPGENRFTEPLGLDRAGIDVTPEDRAVYEGLVHAIEVRAGGGAVWAGPDAPEAYFLSGATNPTRRVFDFLEDGDRDPEAFVRTLEASGVSVVVINRAPGFSAPLSDAVVERIARRWPARDAFGRFEVRWAP